MVVFVKSLLHFFDPLSAQGMLLKNDMQSIVSARQVAGQVARQSGKDIPRIGQLYSTCCFALVALCA